MHLLTTSFLGTFQLSEWHPKKLLIGVSLKRIFSSENHAQKWFVIRRSLVELFSPLEKCPERSFSLEKYQLRETGQNVGFRETDSIGCSLEEKIIWLRMSFDIDFPIEETITRTLCQMPRKRTQKLLLVRMLVKRKFNLRETDPPKNLWFRETENKVISPLTVTFGNFPFTGHTRKYSSYQSVFQRDVSAQRKLHNDASPHNVLTHSYLQHW